MNKFEKTLEKIHDLLGELQSEFDYLKEENKELERESYNFEMKYKDLKDEYNHTSDNNA